MGAPIGPGDWVECVDARQLADTIYSPKGIAVGQIYRVERAEVMYGALGLLLERVRSEHPSGFHRANHFRPIYRPNAELIADLLRRSKEPLRTEAPEPVAARLGVAAQISHEFREEK